MKDNRNYECEIEIKLTSKIYRQIQTELKKDFQMNRKRIYAYHRKTTFFYPNY